MSTSDQDPAREAARRKFDEVASLFGPIVPAAGSPVRLRTPPLPVALPQVPDAALSPDAAPTLAPPPRLRVPQAETLPRPPTEPPPAVPRPVPERKPEPIRFELPPTARPRAEKRVNAGAERKTSAEVPWPDAFSPRPNYRSVRKSRLWYWLFLIPFAAVVAAAISLVDPRSIRTFVDQTLPHYLPAEVTQFFTRPAPTQVRPDVFPPVLPPPASSLISPPSPPTPPAVAEQPVPAAPVAILPAPIEPSPPPAPPEPPQEVAAAPPAAPSEAPPEPSSQPIPPQAPAARVTIYYRRNQAAAENEARRVAAKAGNAEIKPSNITARSPMIYYFNAADRDAATALARTLAGEGAAGWIVRAGPTRPSPGAIDVMLP